MVHGLRQEEFLEEGDYFLITATDFIDGKLSYKDIKYISEYRYRQDPNIQVCNNDIMITKDGTIGKVAIITNITKPATLNAAEKPANFGTENIQENTYMIIPETSSENRNYIPMGFIDADSLASNAVRVVPNATHYIFGILTSIVHMAWMRVVAGRLEMRYRYSKDIVYNNFPWPSVDKATEDKITNTAKMILDVREKYKESTLADMYGENMYLYSDLVKAHEENDKAVLKAYGFKENITEEEIVSELFKMYEKITN